MNYWHVFLFCVRENHKEENLDSLNTRYNKKSFRICQSRTWEIRTVFVIFLVLISESHSTKFKTAFLLFCSYSASSSALIFSVSHNFLCVLENVRVFGIILLRNSSRYNLLACLVFLSDRL